MKSTRGPRFPVLGMGLVLGAYMLFAAQRARAQSDGPPPQQAQTASSTAAQDDKVQEPTPHVPTDRERQQQRQNANQNALAPGSYDSHSPYEYGHLTFHDRLHNYLHSTLSPVSLAGPAFTAGIDQLSNTPSEWGKSWPGYGRRFASSYGFSTINRTITFGVSALDREDIRYFGSGESGFWRRTKAAIVATFVDHTNDGGKMPAFARFTGVYSTAFIANHWEPAAHAHTSDALERGTLALGSSVGSHWLKEFWPDIKRKMHLGHSNPKPQRSNP